MSKKHRPDYNLCADHAPAVWERERVLLFIQEIIDDHDRMRVNEMRNEHREWIASFTYRLEQLKDKISWCAKTKLQDDDLKKYYDQFFQRESKEV